MTEMRYQMLGRSGLRVSELALGTMTFGERWGFGANPDECRRMFDEYVGRGGNFIDTANKYTEGTAERLVGQFIAGDRDRYVVATKYTLSMRDGDPNASGNHRKNLVQSVEGSLRRLATDYIDLLWLHAWDFTTSPDEVMRSLDDLVRAGKLLYIGISDTPAWIVAQCNTIADLRGWTPFVALQIEYSLIQRTAERELLPMARSFGLAVTPWAVVGGGVLTGKYTRGETETPEDSLRAPANVQAKRTSERNLDIARTVDAVADEIGCTSSQVAINWAKEQRGQIIPILGARTSEQLADSLGCLDFSLTPEQRDRLAEASQIKLGFPHEFLRRQRVREAVYGTTVDRLDLDPPL